MKDGALANGCEGLQRAPARMQLTADGRRKSTDISRKWWSWNLFFWCSIVAFCQWRGLTDCVLWSAVLALIPLRSWMRHGSVQVERGSVWAAA